MSKINPPVSMFTSLKYQYLAGVMALLIISALFSWTAHSNVSDLLGGVTEHSKYQLQLSSDLNAFSESFYNIEKLLQFYTQLSDDIIYKQLQHNIDYAESALHKIEYSHWVISHKQRDVISELRSYISAYRVHIKWLTDFQKNVAVNHSAELSNIDTFAKNLRPIAVNVWRSIKQLEDELQALSVIENSRLVKVQEVVTLMMIFAVLLVAAFLLMNLIAIKYWILNPLSLLSSDISDKDDFSISNQPALLELKTLSGALEDRCAKNKERESA